MIFCKYSQTTSDRRACASKIGYYLTFYNFSWIVSELGGGARALFFSKLYFIYRDEYFRRKHQQECSSTKMAPEAGLVHLIGEQPECQWEFTRKHRFGERCMNVSMRRLSLSGMIFRSTVQVGFQRRSHPHKYLEPGFQKLNLIKA